MFKNLFSDLLLIGHYRYFHEHKTISKRNLHNKTFFPLIIHSTNNTSYFCIPKDCVSKQKTCRRDLLVFWDILSGSLFCADIFVFKEGMLLHMKIFLVFQRVQSSYR